MHYLLPVILLTLAGHSYAKPEPSFTSNAGVKIYNPSSCFNTTGAWSLMAQAGDSLYIAITSVTALSRQAFWPKHSVHSILTAAQYQACAAFTKKTAPLRPAACHASAEHSKICVLSPKLTGFVRLVVYTTDMYRYRHNDICAMRFRLNFGVAIRIGIRLGRLLRSIG
jgi:hypothetical protein